MKSETKPTTCFEINHTYSANTVAHIQYKVLDRKGNQLKFKMVSGDGGLYGDKKSRAIRTTKSGVEYIFVSNGYPSKIYLYADNRSPHRYSDFIKFKKEEEMRKEEERARSLLRL